MKVMFISDIHGSFTWLEKAIKIYQEEAFDKLVILGDILYHGPRNPLPDGYNCQKVVQVLNAYKEDIIAVRGNCDAEVDQMVLDFDMMETYKKIEIDGYSFFLTHGHHYDEDRLPALDTHNIFAYGHFHKPVAKQIGDIYIVNPSSISLPKEGTNSYGVYHKDTFVIMDFNGNIIQQLTLCKS